MVFKKDDFQKASRYFKSYGLKAFVIKALERFKLIQPYVLWINKFELNDETVKSQPKLIHHLAIKLNMLANFCFFANILFIPAALW
jgi:hypothetical protein